MLSLIYTLNSNAQQFNLQDYIEVTNFSYNTSKDNIAFFYNLNQKKDFVFNGKKIEFKATVQVYWKNLKIFTSFIQYIDERSTGLIDFQMDLSNFIIPEGKQELTVKLAFETTYYKTSSDVIELENLIHTQTIEVTQKKYCFVDLTIEDIQINERDSDGQLWDDNGFRDDGPDPFVVIEYQKEKTHNFSNGATVNLRKTFFVDPEKSVIINVYDDDFFSREYILWTRFIPKENVSNKTISAKHFNGKIRYNYSTYPSLIEPKVEMSYEIKQVNRNDQLIVDFNFDRKNLIGTKPVISFYLLDKDHKSNVTYKNTSNETNLSGQISLSPLWFVGGKAKLYCSVANESYEKEFYSFCILDSIDFSKQKLDYVDFYEVNQSTNYKGFDLSARYTFSNQVNLSNTKRETFITDKTGKTIDQILVINKGNPQTGIIEYNLEFKPKINVKAEIDTFHFVRKFFYYNDLDSIQIGELIVPFDLSDFCYVDTLFFKIPKRLFSKTSDYKLYFEQQQIHSSQFTKSKGFILAYVHVDKMVLSKNKYDFHYCIKRKNKNLNNGYLHTFNEDNKNKEFKLKRKGIRKSSYHFN